MKLVHIKQIKGSRSLYGTFLYITLLPLVLFGVILMIYSSITLTRNIQAEVSSNLRNVCVAVLAAYDVSYEGDYNVMIVDGVVEFYKGDTFIEKGELLGGTRHEKIEFDERITRGATEFGDG